MHRRYHPAILLGLAQFGIDEVHPVIFQLPFVHQVVLDGARAVLTELAQQHVAATPERDHAVLQFGRALIVAQVFPFRRWLLFQAGAVDAFEQGGFFLFRYLQQGRLGRNLVATALQDFVIVVLVFTFQTLRCEAFIMNGEMFGRKGRLYIWISQDERRLPVQIRVQMPFYIGTVTVTLEKLERL